MNDAVFKTAMSRISVPQYKKDVIEESMMVSPPILPQAVLLGRPNVGKSTLFNRLIRSNRAITHDRPGVTRDRLEGLAARRGSRPFLLVDTGGISLSLGEQSEIGPKLLQGFEQEVLNQAKEAIRCADLLCLVVDAQDGLSPLDERLAAFLRKSAKDVVLIVNKVDGPEKAEWLSADFYALGFPLIPCSAAHGYNLQHLEKTIQDRLAAGGGWSEQVFNEQQEEKQALRLALLGRPNSGKSSLVNALVGTERMIVSDLPGTTRDSVDVHVSIQGRLCTFIDTAGVRRPSKVLDSVERYSVSASLKSTSKAHVTLLLLAADEGLTLQDKRLIDLLTERKTPFMLLLNKADLIAPDQLAHAKKMYRQTLQFCPHIPLLAISALKKKNIQKIVPLAERIYEECSFRIGTGLLNRSLETVLAAHQPPMIKGARAKFFYMTQAESMPPTFVFFVSDADRILPAYSRYLERSLRDLFGIVHAPMRLHFRSSHKKSGKRRLAGP